MSVGVVGRRAWEREAECPVEAVLDDVRVGGSPRGNVSSESSVACSRQGDFRTHEREIGIVCVV